MDEGGYLTLIDVSFAGRVGSAIPSFFPSWVYTDGIYGIGSDIERFNRYIVPIYLSSTIQLPLFSKADGQGNNLRTMQLHCPESPCNRLSLFCCNL